MAVPTPTTGYPLQQALHHASQQLAAAKCGTPGLDAEILLAHSLNQERVWLFTHPNTALDSRQAHTFAQLIARRTQHEPLAYIIGQKAFFGLDFTVTPHVLIPRPETELLVEITLSLMNRPYLTLVDIGTGSGCVVVSIAHTLARQHLPATLGAVDVSAEALRVAHQNATRHGVRQRLTLLQSNLLTAITGPIDLVVSNPPYVSRTDLQAGAIMPDVAHYEPVLALDGGPDGLDIIRQLLEQTKTKLAPGGAILLEIGSTQGQAVCGLAQTHFPQAAIKLCQDLAGLDRVVLVKMPET